MFASPFDLGGATNSSVFACTTSCPRCGGNARVLDSYTDSEGRLYVRDLFAYIQSYRNPKKLEELKRNLEAANEKLSAAELADTLTEIDPDLGQFSELIKSLPGPIVASLATILISIITLLITYQAWIDSTADHKERMEIERAQLEVAKENLEYKKRQDREQEKRAEKERERVNARIEQLKLDFEKKLEDASRNRSRQSSQEPTKSKTQLKGNQRNKPCPCGSGIKAKKCHPNGFPN